MEGKDPIILLRGAGTLSTVARVKLQQPFPCGLTMIVRVAYMMSIFLFSQE